MEQPKEAAVPESPKANDTEDRRENVSEQKRPQVYHRERMLAQSIHVYSSTQLFVRSNWSNQRRQLSQKAPKPMIQRTEEKTFQSKRGHKSTIVTDCLHRASMYIQVYNCFRREEQLEQPKEAAVPESPKANDTEDRRENVSEQKRSQVYHRDRFLAQSIHVHSSIQYTIVFVVRSNWSNQRRQLSQKALKPMIRRTEEKTFQSQRGHKSTIVTDCLRRASMYIQVHKCS